MANINKHEVTLVLPGDINSVRTRLIGALEQLHYHILGEQPIYARRDARTTGYIWSGNVLDYPTTLLVKLKSAGERATRATVQYSVEDKMFFNRGDRQTLSREASALVALVMTEAPTKCSHCEAEVVANSRFCRQCGTPVYMESPAELEVLRLTAALSAAREDIFGGTIMLLILGLILLPVLLLAGPKVSLVISVTVGGIFGSMGLLCLLTGMHRLQRTLNTAKEVETLAAGRRSAAVTAHTVVPASITESTTSLLPEEPEISLGSPRLPDGNLTASESGLETKSL
jgi:hypothetical protein